MHIIGGDGIDGADVLKAINDGMAAKFREWNKQLEIGDIISNCGSDLKEILEIEPDGSRIKVKILDSPYKMYCGVELWLRHGVTTYTTYVGNKRDGEYTIKRSGCRSEIILNGEPIKKFDAEVNGPFEIGGLIKMRKDVEE